MTTIKVYINGWIEYRVDNTTALADAARLTPYEVAPSKAVGLDQVPPEVWDENALLVEVSKRFAQNPPPPPPGAEVVDQNIRYTLSPVTGD